MFYSGSIIVVHTDVSNLIQDFNSNRWGVVFGLYIDQILHSDTETKLQIEFTSGEEFPFDLIRALNTVSSVDFR